jgi:hypothetical protein
LFEIIKKIGRYFYDDPSRILFWLGGSGGLAYWITLYRSRPRLRVEIKKEALDLDSSGKLNMSFEAENLGSAPNSLSTKVFLSALTTRREPYELIFEIIDEDRSLPPYKPRIFSANAMASDDFAFLWFRKYSFKGSCGRRTFVYILSAQGEVIGGVAHYIRSLIFKYFGILPK